MKRLLATVTFALMALTASTAQALPVRHGGEWHRGGDRIIVGVDPWWGVPPPYWYYPPPAYYPPPLYSYAPPVQAEPPVYNQRDEPDAGSNWYYCSSTGAYYPDVDHCSEAWIRVPPQP